MIDNGDWLSFVDEDISGMKITMPEIVFFLLILVILMW